MNATLSLPTHRVVPAAELRGRFLRWKQTRTIATLALVSVAARGLASRGDLLSPAERHAINAARPGSVPVVFRTAPAAAPDEPLPADFTPAPVPDYSPAILADLDKDSPVDPAEVAAEVARIEAATNARFDAVSFDSEPFAGIPSDFAPDGSDDFSAPDTDEPRANPAPRIGRMIMPPRAPAALPIAAATVTAAPMTLPQSEHEALRLAVLSTSHGRLLAAAKAQRAPVNSHGFASLS